MSTTTPPPTAEHATRIDAELVARIDAHSHPWRDADLVRAVYIGHDLERQQVADVLGCSKSCLDDYLTEHGITKGPQRQWPDADTLERLYWEKNLSQADIAEKFNLSQGAISSAFTHHDIDTRDRQIEYGREDLIDHLRAVDEQCDYRVTQSDVEAAEGPSLSPYKARFDSWTAALDAAGIDADAPTKAPSTHRETLHKGQGTILRARRNVAKELRNIDDPFRHRELEAIDRSDFYTLIEADIIQPADKEPSTVDTCDDRRYTSFRWTCAEGVREWIDENIDFGGRCPVEGCESSGVSNLGDGEYTCTNDACDSRFDRETAEAVIGT